MLSLKGSAHTPQSGVSRENPIRLVNHSGMQGTKGDADRLRSSELLNQTRSFVSANLPSYMIPHTWCVIEDMPTLPSAKLDRRMVSEWLEAIDEATLLLVRQLVSVSTSARSGLDSDAEKLVRAAWSTALAIPGGTYFRNQRPRAIFFLRIRTHLLMHYT